jgi:hypothetical protein
MFEHPNRLINAKNINQSHLQVSAMKKSKFEQLRNAYEYRYSNILVLAACTLKRTYFNKHETSSSSDSLACVNESFFQENNPLSNNMK